MYTRKEAVIKGFEMTGKSVILLNVLRTTFTTAQEHILSERITCTQERKPSKAKLNVSMRMGR